VPSYLLDDFQFADDGEIEGPRIANPRLPEVLGFVVFLHP